ncbi:MAG: 4Fe-4S dicluster domain-containing protein [Phycisphaeraceae bacterium]|nr:MAG: 4Fe-4S dicluster domain-containing protein [Phycisphaeraceae bacterium]
MPRHVRLISRPTIPNRTEHSQRGGGRSKTMEDTGRRTRIGDTPSSMGAKPRNTRKSGCTGTRGGRRDVALPVLGAEGPGGAGTQGAPKIRKSRTSRWRAGVLIAVHVLIAAHIAHWLLAGSTVSPVEPSEAMYTLEQGEVNAGFIFFIAAILATLIFGRFFCGWACHVVALQDLCGWMMKKIGVRPKPFRSRLLVWVPLILALYMFVWPTFRRELLAPLLESVWPAGLGFIGATAQFPGFNNHIMTDDFWKTFPTVAVAIPFLFVCGFAIVYFMGAKGFCTYGCPYGGFFAPAQQAAPGRIMVDPDKCEGCGHCTAVCTSNVRVHEEIKAYGGVVDPGCMKCMDCVSVCPNGALSFKFAAPPMMKGKPKGKAPKRTFDMTWPEELAIAGVFALTFFGARGAYGVIPMLFAVGIAGCMAFIAWKMWRMLREPNVRIIGAQLKRAGSVRPAGGAFFAAGAVAMVLIVHSFFIKTVIWRGDALYNTVNPPREILFSGRFDAVPEETRERAARAIRRFTAASGFSNGGYALADTPGLDLRLAWLHLALGDLEESEHHLRRGLDRQGPTEGLDIELMNILVLMEREDEALRHGRNILAAQPGFELVRRELAQLLRSEGRIEEAIELYRVGAEERPDDAMIHWGLGTLLLGAERREEALRALQRAGELAPDHIGVMNDLAVANFATGHVSEAVRLLARAAERDPVSAAGYLQRAGEMLMQAGQPEHAQRYFMLSESAAQRNAGQ